MKALHISNKRPYIDRREIFEFLVNPKEMGEGRDEINEQHKISFNKIPLITQFTTTS